MRHLRPFVQIVAVLAGFLSLTACAMSRADQLHRKSDKVESALKKEQTRVLALDSSDRAARLDHLSGLRATLSAANVGLTAAPHLVEPGQLDIAYDVIEEVYDTIEWNIPLGPGESQRPLPAQFSTGILKLDRSTTKQPVTTSPSITK